MTLVLVPDYLEDICSTISAEYPGTEGNAVYSGSWFRESKASVRYPGTVRTDAGRLRLQQTGSRTAAAPFCRIFFPGIKKAAKDRQLPVFQYSVFYMAAMWQTTMHYIFPFCSLVLLTDIMAGIIRKFPYTAFLQVIVHGLSKKAGFPNSMLFCPDHAAVGAWCNALIFLKNLDQCGAA